MHNKKKCSDFARVHKYKVCALCWCVWRLLELIFLFKICQRNPLKLHFIFKLLRKYHNKVRIVTYMPTSFRDAHGLNFITCDFRWQEDRMFDTLRDVYGCRAQKRMFVATVSHLMLVHNRLDFFGTHLQRLRRTSRKSS